MSRPPDAATRTRLRPAEMRWPRQIWRTTLDGSRTSVGGVFMIVVRHTRYKRVTYHDHEKRPPMRGRGAPRSWPRRGAPIQARWAHVTFTGHQDHLRGDAAQMTAGSSAG